MLSLPIAISVLFALAVVDAAPTNEKRTPKVAGFRQTVKRSGVKAGIAWPSQADASLAEPLYGGDLSWIYNYATDANGLTLTPYYQNQWGSVSSTPDITSAYMLGFNEPDNCDGQSCISAADAVTMYTDYFAPLAAQGIKIGAPAVAGADGWLQNFMSGCADTAGCPTISFIPLHVYQNQFEYFQSYIEGINSDYPDYPIWVTEFSMFNFDDDSNNPTTVQEVNDFMGQATLWLDQTDYIQYYSWFGAGGSDYMGGVSSYNQLQNDDGSLTSLGTQYILKRNADSPSK